MNNDNLKNLLEESLSPIKKQLGNLEAGIATINNRLNDPESGLERIAERVESHTASLMTIEQEIKVYGEMYKNNNDNAVKLEKRVETLEDHAGITSPPELILTAVS